MTTLETVQRLQFQHKAEAEALLMSFLRQELGLDVFALELRPQAVSLNSINGFLTWPDGTRQFFKTHVESDTVINEYYQGELLAGAGYPMVAPVYRSSEVGKQLLIYDLIDAPTVFDLAWQIDRDDSTRAASLLLALQQADDDLLGIYRRTLGWQTAEEAAVAPVHQLFHHRLTGGRLDRFYGDRQRAVPLCSDGTDTITVDVLRRVTWQVNGQRYPSSLDTLIDQACERLNPVQSGPSVIGHGDAHNGNLFLMDQPTRVVYFDPAFAGRHSPLLDLAKPVFHNVFAIWMYYPHEIADGLRLSARLKDGVLEVEHDFTISLFREGILESRFERVVIPLLVELAQRGWLAPDWRTAFRLALMCCPLLTLDLLDRARFPAEIGLLGLAMAVEMGSEASPSGSLIASWLNRAEDALQSI